ncbi:MAG: peroxiredoxin [Parasphingorhabdus sp.]|jgi:peroxiredoxin
MTISVGDILPDANLFHIVENKPTAISTKQVFSGKKTLLFSLPGAFTPTCSAAHLPGYVVNADKILSKGIDQIACLSVNDAWVMQAWGEMQNADNLVMLADGNAELTKAMGFAANMDAGGLGLRSVRYAMIVDDCKVTHLNLEQPREFKVSDAETMMALL